MQARRKPDSTILDLSAMLKLSPATISRALNNHPHVQEKTRQMVLDAAEKMGYRRNTLASGLRNRRTSTIGMIVPRISMFFHAAVITRVQTELYKQGYKLIISQSNDDPAMEKELLWTFYASRVDAILVACSLRTTDFSSFSEVIGKGVPVLFYDRMPPESLRGHIVRGNDFEGGYQAGRELAENGSQRIAHIGGPLTNTIYRDRRDGFLKALEENKIKVRKDWILHQELTAENAQEALNKLFSGKVVPDAIFTANDTTALAVLEYARANKIAVPKALKIVGYSNDPRSAIIRPSISSVEQFPDVVGEKAAETLLELINEGGDTQKKSLRKKVVLPVELIKRNSSQA